MPVEIKFVVDDSRIVTALRSKGGKIVTALASKMTSLMIRLQRKIVVEYLSGQVLHHKSGILAGSVTAHEAQVNGNSIIAWVDSSAGAAFYGKVHENGGEKAYVIYPRDKKALRFMMGSKEVFAKYVFHPPLPKRAFMKPALEDMRIEIVEGLAESLGEAIH